MPDNKKTLVSVVIPAYNGSEWIAETLESVLAQDFSDFEVIVVDDGSKDDTAAVVAGFGKRVRYYRKSNGGQGSARNLGIRAAKGEYIAFVDQDDLWMKEKLRLQVDLLIRTGKYWAYSDAITFDSKSGKNLYRLSKKNRQYEGDILGPLFLSCFIPSPTPVIHRSVFEAVGYFDESEYLRNREDWDMWLRIASKYHIGLISHPLAYYRAHATSIQGGEDPLIGLLGSLEVVEKTVAQVPERLMPLKNRSIASRYIIIGHMIALTGNMKTARQMYRHAISLTPVSGKPYLYWFGCLFGKQMLQGAVQLRRWFYKLSSKKTENI